MMKLPPASPQERDIINRFETRRLALSGDQAMLRERMVEIMRWINPVYDPQSRMIVPHPEKATTARNGKQVFHVDLTGQAVARWAALMGGAMFTFRVVPKYVPPPLPSDDANEDLARRQDYRIDRMTSQETSDQMENQTNIWMEDANLARVLYWMCWSVAAFGKGVIRSSWDPDSRAPTAEVMENPSQVYYGWSKRYGRRRLSWCSVIEEISPEEANRRFDLGIPIDAVSGAVDWTNWLSHLDQSDLDMRSEQTQAENRMVHAIEAWEMCVDPAEEVAYQAAMKTYTAKVNSSDGETLPPTPMPPVPKAMYCYMVANRIIDGPRWYPWKRLPFHIFEDHVLTYAHGKSVSESMIPINQAYDTLIDREAEVIDIESGPRYKGMGLRNSSDEIDVPGPFEMVPLGLGQDILQLDTHIDFFPSQIQGNELREAGYKATGLTPIAWGMSPNAQTSGRSMAAEWRAVELPLTGRLVNIAPEIKELLQSWWDYAEAYIPAARDVAQGYRRFKILWQPLDIRDKTEATQDLIQRLSAGMVDPETAIQESGYENVAEIIQKVRSYWLDPVWNPLRYQQVLTLQQLELSIRMQMIQTQQAEMAMQQQQAQALGPGGGGEQAGGGGAAPGSMLPSTTELLNQGQVAATLEAQAQPTGSFSPAQNQPGGGSPLPFAPASQASLLLRSPMQGGVGSQINVPFGPGQPVGNINATEPAPSRREHVRKR